MESARPVGSGFFPLDHELDVQEGSLTPAQQERLILLASWMPFARACEMMTRLLGVQVSEATTRRHTYTAGTAYEAVQTAQASEQAAPVESSAVPAPMMVSPDGAFVPLVGGVWGEVKTVVIGRVTTPQEEGEPVQTTNLSYFSRLLDAQTFAERATGELRRRGIDTAEQVCAVMDGAEWLDGFVDLHCPSTVRILDFPHAAEYISAIGQLAGKTSSEHPTAWLTSHLHSLKHDGPLSLLAEVKMLEREHAENEEISKKCRYLEKRETRMQYPLYQQQGWPIGSGIVESGNKVVMQARMKGAGMHWEPGHVNPMLALRTAICNDRWDEAWTQLSTFRRK